MDVYDVQRHLHHPEQQAELQDLDLSDLTLRAIANYGVTNDRQMIQPLIGLYRLASSRLSEQARRQIYAPIRERVEAGQLSVNALLPFLIEDPARSVASTAALDYAVMRPLSDGDPLSGPKEVLAMALGGATANAGAVLGGLLLPCALFPTEIRSRDPRRCWRWRSVARRQMPAPCLADCSCSATVA